MLILCNYKIEKKGFLSTKTAPQQIQFSCPVIETFVPWIACLSH